MPLDFEGGLRTLLSMFGSSGLRLVSKPPASRRVFDDAVANFDAPGVRLRLVQDRGQMYLQVAAISDLDRWGETTDWYPVDGVLEFLGALRVVKRSEPIDVELELGVLERVWDPFLGIFRDWPRGKPDLDRFFREAFERRVRAIRGEE